MLSLNLARMPLCLEKDLKFATITWEKMQLGQEQNFVASPLVKNSKEIRLGLGIRIQAETVEHHSIASFANKDSTAIDLGL